jgi:hypothetical protein
MSNDIFFYENRAVYEVLWKNVCSAEHASDDNMAHAHCILNT